MITLEQILNAISTVGFPIVVAGYSLFVLNKTIQKNTAILQVISTKLGLENEVKEDEK